MIKQKSFSNTLALVFGAGALAGVTFVALQNLMFNIFLPPCENAASVCHPGLALFWFVVALGVGVGAGIVAAKYFRIQNYVLVPVFGTLAVGLPLLIFGALPLEVPELAGLLIGWAVAPGLSYMLAYGYFVRFKHLGRTKLVGYGLLGIVAFYTLVNILGTSFQIR